MAKKVVRKSTPDISIIIPAFNEEKRVGKRFPKAWKTLLKQFENFELIFVNDGSKDVTEKILKKLTTTDPRIKLISYSPNYGKGYAVKKGVEQARGKIIGFTDADFAIDLNLLSEAVKKITEGYDLVIGDRKTKKARLANDGNKLRRALSLTHGTINNFFLNLGPIKDTTCGFKFFKAKIAKEIFADLAIFRWFFDLDVLIKSRNKGYRIHQLPVRWEEVGGSRVSYLSMIKSSLKEHLAIYSHFFNLKIFTALTIGILFLLFLPFWLFPQNLTQRNGDYSDLVWPDYYFIKQTILSDHQIPLWNPTLFSGIPEIANPQSPLIYPPNLLALFLPIDLSLIVLICLHGLLSAAFLFKLGREVFKFQILPALILAYGYTFSPFLISKISIGHVSMVMAMFLVGPIAYFAAKLLQKFSWKNLIWVSIFLAGQYLNYPTIWYYTLFFGLPSLLVFSYWRKKIKNFFYAIFSLIISLILILPVFLVQLQAGPLITRSSLTTSDLAIPIWSLSRFFKAVLVPSNLYSDNEAEVWLYGGLVALGIAIWGLIRLKIRYQTLALLVLGLVILLTLGNRTPVFYLFSQYIPGFSYLRVVTRDWFVFIFAIAILAAFGLEKIRKYQLTLTILIAADLFIFSLARLWFVPLEMQYSVNQNLQSLIQFDQNYRYYCTSRCLSARETVPAGVMTADGYHLLILKDYRVAISSAGGFNPPEYTGNLPTYSVASAQPSAEKLGQMTVKWVVSDHNLTDPNFIPVKSAGKFKLWQNNLALPRFYFAGQNNNQIKVIKNSSDQIILQTQGQAGTLVIADSFYPGWEAAIDGQKVPIEKYANWAKSIQVQVGNHQISFQFQPFAHLLER